MCEEKKSSFAIIDHNINEYVTFCENINIIFYTLILILFLDIMLIVEYALRLYDLEENIGETKIYKNLKYVYISNISRSFFPS
jgi:hypothetical protein